MIKFEKPLVSIIIANYNKGQYIEDAINSVLNQSYSNWEIIIVDDASTDNSKLMLEKYESDERINIFFNINNRGVGYTKKKCVDNSKGGICAILDSDDVLKPSALEVLVEKYNCSPSVSMIIGRIENVDSELNYLYDIEIKEESGKSILDNFGTVGWDTFRRDRYYMTDGYDSNLDVAEDQDLYFKMEEIGEVSRLDDILYQYRQYGTTLSSGTNIEYAYENKFYVMEKAVRRRKYNVSEKVYKNLGIFYINLAFKNELDNDLLYKGMLYFWRYSKLQTIFKSRYFLFNVFPFSILKPR